MYLAQGKYCGKTDDVALYISPIYLYLTEEGLDLDQILFIVNVICFNLK